MRVVLDTNVLIAAEVSDGMCRRVRARVLREHGLLLSQGILDELRDKLIRVQAYGSSCAGGGGLLP